jgi:hypothetical protein
MLNFYFLVAPAARGFVANASERDKELVATPKVESRKLSGR